MTDKSFHERGAGQFILVSVNYVDESKTKRYAGEGGELVEQAAGDGQSQI